jgi:formimidoylglutamate deiminase
MSGVTAVGEFHYLHHGKNGVPYANRIETAEACIQAALDVGIRICLIRAGYMRGSFEKPLEPAQQRFSDPNVDLILQDVDTLRHKYANNPLVSVSLAAHSVRAMPLAEIKLMSEYANQHQLPFHMHVCEQRKELAESQAEYGMTPIQLLAEHGVINGRFVGTHATHLSADEIKILGDAEAMVCVCRTTERDLGDGVPQASTMLNAGVRFCVGIDSHAEGNAFEEIRAIESDERSRLEARHTVAEAPQLLEMGSRLGYIACNFADQWQTDQVFINRDAPQLVGIDDKHAIDGIVFGATPEAVERVVVDGKEIVRNGRCSNWPEITNSYKNMLNQLNI